MRPVACPIHLLHWLYLARVVSTALYQALDTSVLLLSLYSQSIASKYSVTNCDKHLEWV